MSDSREELRQRMVEQLQSDREAALAAGNVAAAVSASKAIADLLSIRLRPDEEPPEVEAEPIDARHASRCILNTLDEYGRELGFQVHITQPGETVIRLKTPADSELLRRLYPDAFRDEPLSFAGFPALQENFE
ncbi:hypothetical protein [Sinorhizobium fredii]|uniref:hypothetical protein n=1 Tax=Rhizobium fredii TaxID=380 RepID=UPI0004B08642|nr:hypothetical protein [Sinorhizobium fredii]